jgi:hypothetical protein
VFVCVCVCVDVHDRPRPTRFAFTAKAPLARAKEPIQQYTGLHTQLDTVTDTNKTTRCVEWGVEIQKWWMAAEELCGMSVNLSIYRMAFVRLATRTCQRRQKQEGGICTKKERDEYSNDSGDKTRHS